MEPSDASKSHLFGASLIDEVEFAPQFEPIVFLTTCHGQPLGIHTGRQVIADEGPTLRADERQVEGNTVDGLSGKLSLQVVWLPHLFDELQESSPRWVARDKVVSHSGPPHTVVLRLTVKQMVRKGLRVLLVDDPILVLHSGAGNPG